MSRIQGTNSMRIKTKDMAYAALMAVLLAACSWLSVPAAVPFTMQTFGVFCALLILGGRLGTVSILVYILLGAAGLPVFSGFRGGLSVLLGPTGGYIAGFLICGLWCCLVEKHMHKLPMLIAGNLLCYAFGTAWFVIVYSAAGKAVSVAGAVMTCVVSYMVPDAAKLALALYLSGRIKKYVFPKAAEGSAESTQK